MGAEPRISATTLRLFVDALASAGVDREEVLRRCALDRETLEDSEKRLPLSRYEQVFREAEAVSGDPAIGLHAAEHVVVRAVNLFGYMMLSSSTLIQGIRRVVRYQGILTEAPWIWLDETAEPVRVIIDTKWLDENVRSIHADYTLALVIAIVSWVSDSDVRALEARYDHAPRGDATEYQRVMRCPARFDAGANELLFAPETLARPSVHHDAMMEKVHVDFAEWMLATIRDKSVAGGVRRVLAQRLEEGPLEIREVARQLGMSIRSLQRRLAAEGTSFRVVLETLRRDLAREHLEHLGTPISEIAYLTGFSEVSAFTRAAVRWFGRTPSRIRRERRSERSEPGDPDERRGGERRVGPPRDSPDRWRPGRARP